MGSQPLKEDYDKEDQLWEWINSSGEGIMCLEFGSAPDECFQFCLDQYARFGVPFVKEIADVVLCAASAVFHYIDLADPYAIFKGISAVDLTFDWCMNAYQLHDVDGSRAVREADPERLETFKFMPGQSEQSFNNLLAKPGLMALPWGVGYGIREILEGGYGEECWDGIDETAEKALAALCTPAGASKPDTDRMLAYFELAAWATFVWLIGPEGQQFLAQHHEIVWAALTYGEVIMHEGTVYTPSYYTKLTALL